MAISDKLNYLTDTKDLFKDRLNSLGAEITSSTTFRNYLNWLDTFYGEVSDKTDLSQNGVVGRTSQNTAILPSEYTQVDYIRSTGNQYIDTGINADYKLSVKAKISIPSTQSNVMFGAMSGTVSASRIRHHFQIANFISYWAGKGDSGCQTVLMQPFTIDDTYDIFCDIYNKKYYLNNVEIQGNFNSNDFDTGINYYLFARNRGNNVDNFTVIKLYSFKMYYENELVRDFIPCYRNSDNEVGLYDIVNDVFYTNQGTGTFAYGSAVSIPNPDYPQPINNLSGDVSYKVSGKNKLPFPYTETSHTNNGITYTINDDGSVLVNGTATIQSNTKLYGNFQEVNNKEPIGKYLYGGTNGVRVRALNNTGNRYTVLATDTGNGAEIDTSVYKKYYIEISVLQGVTVNNVLIKPMVLDSLEDTTYEPYISQTFNMPLKSKNLANLDIIGRVPSVSNGQMVDFPNGVSSDFIEVDNTKEYIFQYDFSGTNQKYIFFYDEDKNFISSISGATVPSGMHINSFSSFSRSKYIKLRIDKQSNLNWVQLEENTTPTDYEPYYDIELCKIDTYEDKIYSSDSRFYLEKNIGNHTIDTNDTVSPGASSTDGYVRCGWGLNQEIAPSNFTKKLVVCNKFLGVPQNDNTNSLTGQHWYCSVSNTDGFKIMFRAGDITFTKTQFQEFLKNNNIIVYYLLNTPTTTEITQENYPSLYNALKQIQDYLTAYKINKEFILGYTSPEIEY